MKQQLRFHHIGIPTDREMPPEDYNAKLKMHASGYFDSPYAVEWMKFDADNDLPELVKTVPHAAFVVDDIQRALEGKTVIVEPSSPSDGVTTAFIVDNGAPIEFLQFDRPEQEVWPHPNKFKI